jgi:hypothetical protein
LMATPGWPPPWLQAEIKARHKYSQPKPASTAKQ